MQTSRVEHTKILLGSLNKEFKQAQRKGTFSVRDLFFLNCIQKTINFSCEIGMTGEEQRQLTTLYFKILRGSNKFCVQEFSSTFYKSTGNAFETYVQETSNSTHAPTVDDNVITIGQDVVSNKYNIKFNLKYK